MQRIHWLLVFLSHNAICQTTLRLKIALDYTNTNNKILNCIVPCHRSSTAYTALVPIVQRMYLDQIFKSLKGTWVVLYIKVNLPGGKWPFISTFNSGGCTVHVHCNSTALWLWSNDARFYIFIIRKLCKNLIMMVLSRSLRTSVLSG